MKWQMNWKSAVMVSIRSHCCILSFIVLRHMDLCAKALRPFRRIIAFVNIMKLLLKEQHIYTRSKKFMIKWWKQYSRYVTIAGMKKMSKAQGLHRYLRTISRKLVCYKDTKQTLLEGLEQELSVYSSLSYDELCQEIGNPTQVSAQLMENISEQEIAYMKRRRKMILYTVSICFVIAFALAVFYFVHAQFVMRGDFYVQEHNTVESDTFVSSGTLDDN